LNGDGKPDLAVANLSSSTVSILLNTTVNNSPTPSFSTKTDFSTGSNAFYVTISDLNGDSKNDLLVVNLNSNSVSVLFNTAVSNASTPSFSTKTDFVSGGIGSPHSVAAKDLNNDGKPDIVIANFDGTPVGSISILFNTTATNASTPSFSASTNFATMTNPSSVSISDLNADNKPDIAVVNWTSNSISVFFNNTATNANSPTLSDKTEFSTGSNPISIKIIDLNSDNKPDFVIANASNHTVSVLLNTTVNNASTPSFSSKIDFTTGNFPGSIAVSDLNGDNKPDFATANIGGNSVSVLLNTTSVTGIEEVKNFIPTDFTLKQNYPNPFNPSTNINFSLPDESFVTLKIYDILGREVVQLVNKQLKTGNYNFSFDAKGLTSGVYFYRLQTHNFVETKKMLLLK